MLCDDVGVTTAPTSRLHRLTTPRAAALAGVLFAVLFGTALVLVRTAIPDNVEQGVRWVDPDSSRVTLAATLIPFAGIAFLWFIGVVRDGFGQFEDKFFSSVFIGSGLLFVAMTFVWSAVGLSLVRVDTAIIDSTARSEVVAFAHLLMETLSQTYALRMASVCMISLATIWLRTGLMPRWLVGVSYALAVALMVASEVSMWVTLAFPVWVLVVSVILLQRAGVLGLRGGHDGPVRTD